MLLGSHRPHFGLFPTVFYPTPWSSSFSMLELMDADLHMLLPAKYPYRIVNWVQVWWILWPLSICTLWAYVDRNEAWTICSDHVLGFFRFVRWSPVLLEIPPFFGLESSSRPRENTFFLTSLDRLSHPSSGHQERKQAMFCHISNGHQPTPSLALAFAAEQLCAVQEEVALRTNLDDSVDWNFARHRTASRRWKGSCGVFPHGIFESFASVKTFLSWILVQRLTPRLLSGLCTNVINNDPANRHPSYSQCLSHLPQWVLSAVWILPILAMILRMFLTVLAVLGRPLPALRSFVPVSLKRAITLCTVDFGTSSSSPISLTVFPFWTMLWSTFFVQPSQNKCVKIKNELPENWRGI